MSTPVAALPKNVSRETYAHLKQYESLLLKWQKSINLVSSRQQDIWERHILDSLQLSEHISSGKELELVDLGSGGGLPGLVLAIAQPHLHVTLVESDGRKSVFLSEVSRQLRLTNVAVLNKRIENLTDAPPCDIVTSRALAPLSQLLAYSQPLLKKDAFCLFLKGKNWANEVTQARQAWQFALQDHASTTDSQARVLIIQELSKANASEEMK